MASDIKIWKRSRIVDGRGSIAKKSPCLSFPNSSSQNGSPLEATEAGSVVATVTKKRRGNDSANFEINVGDGRTISLNDPDGVQQLDSEMKATAASQLKVLQDQMASLMAQLTQ